MDGHRLEAGRTDTDLGGDLAQATAQRVGPGRVRHRHAFGPEAPDLVRELLDVAPRGESDDPVTLRKCRGHGEALLSHAPRAPQNCQSLHGAPPSLTWALVSPTLADSAG